MRSNPLRLLALVPFVACPLFASASQVPANEAPGLAGGSAFQLLAKEPFLALFLALGFGHLLGRVKVRGFTLGSTASTLLVALLISGVAFSSAGIRFQIPDLVLG